MWWTKAVVAGGWAIATLVIQPEQHIAAKLDRRRRMRTKMGLHVRIEGGRGTLQAFEDTGKTIDVSRHGLLIATSMSGYWVGQTVQVTCPFWSTPVAINARRQARVIRTILLPNCSHAIAIEFQDGVPDGSDHAFASSPFANQVRVLGVESDARMASAATALLTQDGYHVLFVSTTQQALDILKNETPNVIIAEAEGGEVSGHDLCAIVKTCERLQHVPVILMTRSALPSDYSAGHQLGAMVCMAKPCKPARLQQAVHLVAAPPSQQSVYSAAFNMGAFVRTCQKRAWKQRSLSCDHRKRNVISPNWRKHHLSLEPISLRLQGRQGWLRPGSYLVAVRAFWSLLQDLDVALSGEEKGSVDWEISACKRSGPAVVMFLGHLRKPPKDVVGEVRRTLFNGIRKLSASDERPHGFTDTALQELKALAEQRALMDEIAVIVDEKEELIQWSFIERIERMTHNDFEALSSVAGTLESISVGKNGRFSVRSEVTGRPVICRFKRDQFTVQAKENLGRRVVVFGNLKSNYLGEPMHMRVSGIEPCPSEQDLPNIPRMSGRIPVTASTTLNRIYIPGAKYGK